MAQELDNMPSFSIEDTMDGVGNTQLLNDLFADEVATDPADIQEITPPTLKKESPKKEEPEKKNEEKKEEPAQNLLASFLETDEEEEEAEPAKKTPEKKEEAKTDEEADDEPSQFAALAADLFKLGVFSEEEGEEPISTPEQFLDKFENEKKQGAIKMVNDFIGQFGEDYQQAFEAIFVKGVNPKDYFSTYNTIVNFAELDLTKEDNQVAVLTQALKDQGFEDEDIATEIERVKNYGDLEQVAQRHHKALVKKEAQKLQQMEQQAQQELQQKQAIKQQYIQNVQNILQDKLKIKEFDGIPLNPQLANELQDFLLRDKWETSKGEKLTDFDKTLLELKDPKNHAQKVKVALILKLLEKDPTLSTIQKAGVSKKSDKLFETVTKVAKKEVKNEQPKSWFQ